LLSVSIQQEMTYLNYFGFAFRVKQNLLPSYMLLPPPRTRREKPWERDWRIRLCVSKIADTTLSSEDEDIVNPHCHMLSQKTKLS